MKRFLILAFALLVLSARLPAQNGVTGNLTASSTDCTTTNACIEIDVPQNVGGATLKLSGTFSATAQFEASGDPLTVSEASANWVAISATPSNSTTTATSATAAGVWQVNLAGYRRIRIRVSTFVSGTVVAAINLSTASARGGGGGGSGGGTITSCTTTGGVAFENGTANTLTCDPSLSYSTSTGLSGGPNAGLFIDTPAGTFAAPIVTPAVSGSSTWSYIIIARHGNLNVAVSPAGQTTTGTATLSGTDSNGISWTAFTGADHYDIYGIVSPSANYGYIASVTGTSYTDTGATMATAYLAPSESGFTDTQQGFHVGNTTLNTVSSAIQTPFQGTIYSPVESFLTWTTPRPSLPDSGHLNLAWVGSGNFFTKAQGSTEGVNALTGFGTSDSNAYAGAQGGIQGVYGIATYTGSTALSSWVVGTSGAATHKGSGLANLVVGLYGDAGNSGGGTTNTLVGVEADLPGGHSTTGSAIGFWGRDQSNYAPNNYDFYAEATHAGTGTNYGFYSAGGKSHFDLLETNTYSTTTNCSGVGTAANPSVATCTAAAAGSFSCATNASTGTCTVNTTAVTANSQIFVQEDDSLGTKLGVTCNTNNVLPTSAPLLGARSGGTSFTINLGTFTTNPLCFSYFIVN